MQWFEQECDITFGLLSGGQGKYPWTGQPTENTLDWDMQGKASPVSSLVVL